jgi:multiple sugar transport system permease protein
MVVPSYRSEQRALRHRRINTVLVIGLLAVASVIVLLPIVWTFSTSLRLPRESFELPPRWLPTDWQWQNYARVFELVPFARYIANSIMVATATVAGQVVTATLAAYAFARLRFPYKNVLFVLLMSGLMVPFFVTIIPVFRLVSSWGLVDTLWALILPSLVTPFGVFLLRQFFLTIPTDLEDAAKIDGAGPFQIFRHIFVPLGVPGIAVFAILSFNTHWNDFFRPFIFLNNQNNYTIPLGIVALRGPLDTGELSVVLAGVMMSLVPMIVVVIFAQRYLIEGIVLTGTKG